MNLVRKYKHLGVVIAAGIAALGSAGQAQAQNPAVDWQLNYDSQRVGARSTQRYLEGLDFTFEIRRINVNGDKNEICVRFQRPDDSAWEGGYRITNRNDTSTFATLRVPAGGAATRCEILPVAWLYTVVLNEYDR